MILDDKQIIKFQTLYKSHFGKEISKEDAYEQGIKLVRLMSLVYQPMTEDQYNAIQRRRQETLPLFIN